MRLIIKSKLNRGCKTNLTIWPKMTCNLVSLLIHDVLMHRFEGIQQRLQSWLVTQSKFHTEKKKVQDKNTTDRNVAVEAAIDCKILLSVQKAIHL